MRGKIYGDVLKHWRKMGRAGDDWMYNGKEFQRTDAATGNERCQTADREKGGTYGSCVKDDQSRQRLGRSATWTSWLEYGVRPCGIPWLLPWSRGDIIYHDRKLIPFSDHRISICSEMSLVLLIWLLLLTEKPWGKMLVSLYN